MIINTEHTGFTRTLQQRMCSTERSMELRGSLWRSRFDLKMTAPLGCYASPFSDASPPDVAGIFSLDKVISDKRIMDKIMLYKQSCTNTTDTTQIIVQHGRGNSRRIRQRPWQHAAATSSSSMHHQHATRKGDGMSLTFSERPRALAIELNSC